MTLSGKVHNGVVVFDDPAHLPEGTPVTVVVESHQSDVSSGHPSAKELQQRKAALAELLAMPNENPGDPFCGADHDQVLYGDAS